MRKSLIITDNEKKGRKGDKACSKKSKVPGKLENIRKGSLAGGGLLGGN